MVAKKIDLPNGNEPFFPPPADGDLASLEDHDRPYNFNINLVELVGQDAALDEDAKRVNRVYSPERKLQGNINKWTTNNLKRYYGVGRAVTNIANPAIQCSRLSNGIVSAKKPTIAILQKDFKFVNKRFYLATNKLLDC